MKTSSRLIAVALAATVPFSLTACGGNPQADHAKASIKAMLIKDQKASPTSPQLTDDQNACIAGSMVDKVGLKQLAADGMLDKSNNAVDHGLGNVKLSAGDATNVVNAMFDCTNGGGIILSSLKKSINTNAAAASPAALSCIDSKITESFTKDLMKAIFSRDSAQAQALQTTLGTCLTATH